MSLYTNSIIDDNICVDYITNFSALRRFMLQVIFINSSRFEMVQAWHFKCLLQLLSKLKSNTQRATSFVQLTSTSE